MILSGLIVFSVPDFAQVKGDAQPASPPGFVPSVLQVHEQVQSDLQWLANTADWLLGGTRGDDTRSRGTLRLHADYHARENAKPDHAFHVQVITKLATLERWQRRLQSWFERERQELSQALESRFEAKTASSRVGAEDSKANGELAPQEKSVWHFNLDKKLRYHQPKTFNATIKARLRRDQELGDWLLSSTASLGWSSPKIWEAQASTDFYRHLTASWLLTLGNSLNYDLVKRALVTSHGPSLSRILSRHQAVSLGLGLSTGRPGPRDSWKISGLSVPLNYRIEFIKTGLFAAISPSLNFPRAQNYRGEAGVLISLQQVF